MEYGLEAYRIFCPSRGLPGFAVDIYGKNAVIHLFEASAIKYMGDIEKALRDTLQITDCFYKNRTDADLRLPVKPHKEIVIQEYGCKFLINLTDYLDTGLFLDHRDTRRWIGSLSAGKTVLNTFAYTGSFSVYAALGGAAMTYSVDLSKTYCEWTKQNLGLNGLPAKTNWIYKMDTLEFFKYARKKKLVFDIIIIDPPTFSKNKGKHFSVQKDYPRLINEALGLLAPGGFILFSNNYKVFVLNRKAFAACQITEKKDTIPPDFAGMLPHRCWVIKRTENVI
jgi:23S rRNA (cytosine1962-C5)-methyltransferase